MQFLLIASLNFKRKENDAIEIGGEYQECEADEVAFRCRAEKDTRPEGERDPSGWVIIWLRYIAIVRRLSSKIFLGLLPDRPVGGSGQGGGGALSKEELINIMKPNSLNPRLKRRSILHTDSAKAYKKVGLQRWPEAGSLHANFEDDSSFKNHEYTHTNVTHKKKPGQKAQYVAIREIVLPDGTKKSVKAGTQKVDGFWATLRRAIARRSVNAGGANSLKRGRLCQLVRVFQWSYWHLDEDRFTLLGQIYGDARAKQGAEWVY